MHDRIRKMIRCIFESAALVQPEMHNPRSRAIYGIDVMLDNLFMPKILEVHLLLSLIRSIVTLSLYKAGIW
jgi:tubulin--tyrosine ligase-like protein 12